MYPTVSRRESAFWPTQIPTTLLLRAPLEFHCHPLLGDTKASGKQTKIECPPVPPQMLGTADEGQRREQLDRTRPRRWCYRCDCIWCTWQAARWASQPHLCTRAFLYPACTLRSSLKGRVTSKFLCCPSGLPSPGLPDRLPLSLHCVSCALSRIVGHTTSQRILEPWPSSDGRRVCYYSCCCCFHSCHFAIWDTGSLSHFPLCSRWSLVTFPLSIWKLHFL